MIRVDAYTIAQRFSGLKEVPGQGDNPQILAMLKLDDDWPEHDEVPWCSAFMNYICWLLRLPRSKSLMARSWLEIGKPIHISEARAGFDVVILKRGGDDQPGPEVPDAPGHVGLFAGLEDTEVLLLGGNQGDRVRVSHFPVKRILGVRRLWDHIE